MDGFHSLVGRFPYLKMGWMIAFESLLERDFIYLRDYDLRVEWFEEQPLTIEYLHDGQTLHYAPDFHLVEAGQQGAGAGGAHVADANDGNSG